MYCGPLSISGRGVVMESIEPGAVMMDQWRCGLRCGLGAVDGRRRECATGREREFIFHIAKTLEQVHNRNAKLGGLPERHLAHQS